MIVTAFIELFSKLTHGQGAELSRDAVIKDIAKILNCYKEDQPATASDPKPFESYYTNVPCEQKKWVVGAIFRIVFIYIHNGIRSREYFFDDKQFSATLDLIISHTQTDCLVALLSSDDWWTKKIINGGNYTMSPDPLLCLVHIEHTPLLSLVLNKLNTNQFLATKLRKQHPELDGLNVVAYAVFLNNTDMVKYFLDLCIRYRLDRRAMLLQDGLKAFGLLNIATALANIKVLALLLQYAEDPKLCLQILTAKKHFDLSYSTLARHNCVINFIIDRGRSSSYLISWKPPSLVFKATPIKIGKYGMRSDFGKNNSLFPPVEQHQKRYKETITFLQNAKFEAEVKSSPCAATMFFKHPSILINHEKRRYLLQQEHHQSDQPPRLLGSI